MRSLLTTLFIIPLALLPAACGAPARPPVNTAACPTPEGTIDRASAPTVEEALAFIKSVEQEMLRLWVDRERASWVKSTYITHDTELIAAKFDEAVMEFTARKSAEAVHFDKLELPEEARRKFNLLKLSLSLPAPREASKRAALARISSFMESTYGKGKYCPKRLKGKCMALGELSDVIAKSRKYSDLMDVWQGWRQISRPMRERFEEYVELANEGARELGFANLGDLWKSRYDMSPDAFEAEVDRLWEQVKPLYQDLHCYTRAKLQAMYGKAKVPDKAPIPAHLLGNMWSQDWSNLFDLLAPQKGRSVDLDRLLRTKKVDELGMVRYAEGFFVSLGLDMLPSSFWDRSMFTKPKDREVVCHASAWDIDFISDLRIKMCIKINGEDFTTIHHELGHNYYQHYYRDQPALFRDSANDGFHEALGDTIALSVTPSYLVRIGLLKQLPKDNLNPLMQRALEKIAFLPFGLMVDKWRWDVFAGKIKPADYNKGWWQLREKYQGITPPVPRTEEDFDPGAKYHIPANVPYTRYFLAAILQFQFHRALCKQAGHEGPLHTCSNFKNREAGKRLEAMMTMGQSRPWPEALKALTGEEKMDASAIIDYFQPLHVWLKEQNKSNTCGW